jgi:uncharacterized protein (UPF0261 family)
VEPRQRLTIVLVGTLDTKGVEIGYLQQQIMARGHDTVVVDAGVLGRPQIQAHIGRDQVARAGGETIAALQSKAQQTSDRMLLIQVMRDGAAHVVTHLYNQGQLDGIVAIGGSMGMSIGVAAMQGLPVGVPKLLVGTHLYPQYLGEADLTIMQSPTDLMGLNPITNRVLVQAASAVCAMAEATGTVNKHRPLVAMTGLGVTTPAVMAVQQRLDAKGYDTVVFHGNSEVMDALVDRGVIDGILDVSPNELIRIVIVEETPWRASRLESAGRRGLPQVIVPGSLDMIVLRLARDQIPDPYKTRKLYRHGPYITGVRTTAEELRRLAACIAEKLNRATGPAAVIIPLRGFSAIDQDGFAFYEPQTDQAFAAELHRTLRPGIDIIEVDAHLLEPHFATAVADVYDAIAKQGVGTHD